MYTDSTGESPIVGIAFQLGVSLVSYAGMCITSIFDEEVRDDMQSISWNPFNIDTNTVLESNKVSFYKGVPVFHTELDRSFSFGAIMLQDRVNYKTHPIDILKHEYGHNVQLSLLGPIKYSIGIGVPSASEMGPWSKEGNYYSAPWEVTADIFGGVQSRTHDTYSKTTGIAYFIFLMLLG